MNLIATAPLRYNTRQLLPGDPFQALSPRDGNLLIIAKKAKKADVRVQGKVAAPSPAQAEVIAANAQASDAAELDNLRATAEAAGIQIDRRWGAKRLQAEIAAAKQP